MLEISACAENHFWVFADRCPFCGKEAIKKVEYYEGDCVRCGALCQAGAYACTSPMPIEKMYDLTNEPATNL